MTKTSSAIILAIGAAVLGGVSAQLQLDPIYQPKVTVVDCDRPSEAYASISLPEGSTWCGGKPTFWIVGHQWSDPERVFCQEPDGSWSWGPHELELDKKDYNSINFAAWDVIDRHGCATIDVNYDGLLDIICVGGETCFHRFAQAS